MEESMEKKRESVRENTGSPEDNREPAGSGKSPVDRMKELIPVLQEAAKAYYQEDREIMSNKEYDDLYSELESLEKRTWDRTDGQPYSDSGLRSCRRPAKGAAREPHAFPG